MTDDSSNGGSLLRFGAEHPDELGIIAPDGTWFFVVYREDADHPSLRPLMSKSTFHAKRELRISTAMTEGSPWIRGRTTNERIFIAPGRYDVVLTEALESDAPGTPTFRCSVTYAP